MVTIGFALFFIGAAGMDSDRILIPALLVFGGMALILAAVRRKTI